MSTLLPPAEKNGSVTPITGSAAGPIVIVNGKVHTQVDDKLEKQRAKDAHANVTAGVVLAAKAGGKGLESDGKEGRQNDHAAHKADGFGHVAEDKIVPGVGHDIVDLVKEALAYDLARAY